MDIFLISLAIVFSIIGIIGAIIPGIPGPPISYLSLIFIRLTNKTDFTNTFLISMALLAIIITLLDYYVPIYGTKISGGTKAGARGSLIGLIIAVLVLPFLGIVIGPFGIIGILLGPFLGAYLGEKLAGTPENLALKAAFGSFIGFLAGTLMKLVYCFVTLGIIGVQLYKMIF